MTAADRINGELGMSTNMVVFVGLSSSWLASFTSLEAVCKRRYQLKDIALEFFLSSGGAHLVVFSDAFTRT